MTDVKDIATEAMSGKADLNVADLRERLAARLQADQDAVDAARAAITQGPSDAQSKALAETMFARIWPGLKEQIASADDLGLGVATDAMRNADPIVRPLLTSSVIEALTDRGLRDESIDKFFLVPTSPALQAALDEQHKNKIHVVYAQHNLDHYEAGTNGFVAPQGE
ncbi:hypothetical protein FND50_12640 [Rhodococcus sp. WB9]|uniref:hypothetical protein n=1 Tax=Rhodococcus sp. WB9 TaxID=2594007 RepID=UPI0011866DB6|nr:hypothetical protein [Rhodococcus sp. WB9]QDQ91581.1 hypothetical protein FND50_12640 [Rhodococcus sp. WB9]